MKYIEAQITHSSLMAQYYMTLANTGKYKERKVFRSENGIEREETDEEKLKGTLSIAKVHIDRVQTLMESIELWKCLWFFSGCL